MRETPKGPRVAFFVDGFNLYHSVKAAERLMPDSQLKWLDIPALCESYLYQIGGGATLESVHYFTAYAEYLRSLNPEKVNRHKAFVRALTACKANAHIGHFRKKRVWSHQIEKWVNAFEEKETDVAIACEVLAMALEDQLDAAVLITGDSDFAPVHRCFAEHFPNKSLLFAFPFNRASKELKKLCPNAFSISKEAYAKHQLPDEIRLPSGKYVTIPDAWKAGNTNPNDPQD